MAALGRYPEFFTLVLFQASSFWDDAAFCACTLDYAFSQDYYFFTT